MRSKKQYLIHYHFNRNYYLKNLTFPASRITLSSMMYAFSYPVGDFAVLQNLSTSLRVPQTNSLRLTPTQGAVAHSALKFLVILRLKIELAKVFN